MDNLLKLLGEDYTVEVNDNNGYFDLTIPANWYYNAQFRWETSSEWAFGADNTSDTFVVTNVNTTTNTVTIHGIEE